MNRFKTFGCIVATVLAFSVMVVGNASAALEFKSSAMGELVGIAMENQVFTTKAGTTECKSLELSNAAAVLSSTTQVETVRYKECKETTLGLAVTITPVEIELNTNGTARVLKAFTASATACTITVPAQTLSSLTYTNVEGEGKFKVLIEPKVTGVESSGSGFACSYALEKVGTYKGMSLVELPGGHYEV